MENFDAANNKCDAFNQSLSVGDHVAIWIMNYPTRAEIISFTPSGCKVRYNIGGSGEYIKQTKTHYVVKINKI